MHLRDNVKTHFSLDFILVLNYEIVFGASYAIWLEQREGHKTQDMS